MPSLFSFLECFETCNGLNSCIGFAHIANNCMMYLNDTHSKQAIPRKLKKRYLMLMDHLLLLPKHKGKSK